MTAKIGIILSLVAIAIVLLNDCGRTEQRHIPSARTDDVIVVCGERFHTGSRVILWDDPDGFDGYRERRFFDESGVLPTRPAEGCDTPRRYSVRDFLLDEEGRERRVWRTDRGRAIRDRVDQIVLHYDAAGTSRTCFKVLHDERGLSAHFLLDVDGVIYQALDVRERARHAGFANDRSVGVEIANVGAYGSLEALRTADQKINARNGHGAARKSEFEPIVGYAQGRRLHQYPFTDAQYEALIKLVRALGEALPGVELRFPASSNGEVAGGVLSRSEWERFSGVLAHFHVSASKVDPGPAFNWRRLMAGMRDTRVD